ncbi:unnamed protein product [Rhizoctonia solani]|uniref:5'-nucleotidase n=1 Tax=Rhizoctonia solani TaxID=456999 RepID=A0A8H3GQZ8_9AGAM|nr:unnamed protein product [Rhizoctonia solani]
MNELAPDACVPGNHEFDYERSQFDQLIKFCNFPWVLSNARDKTASGDTLKGHVRYLLQDVVLDQQKLRIGIMGDTVSKIGRKASKTFELLDMKEECMKLAKELRENHKCDLVFALTHSLYSEDFELGKHANCYTVGDFNGKLEDKEGVDLILGGHNHEYFVGKGISKESVIEPKTVNFKGPLDDDDGLLPAANSRRHDYELRHRIIKSGTDFQDLSEIEIEVEDKPEGEVRKKVIKSVKVVRHHAPGPNNSGTVLGNWIADSMIRWYDTYRTDSMPELDRPVFIMTGGSIRSGADEIDSSKITKGDIVRLLPFNTPLVTLKMKGEDLRETLRCALRYTGRDKSGSFPVVSGIEVEWDSAQTDNQKRVKSVRLSPKDPEDKTNQEDEIKDGKEYDVLTHTYLYEGGDGLKPFETYSKAEKGYITDVPIYEALLRVINAISLMDAVALTDSPSHRDSMFNKLLEIIPDNTEDIDDAIVSQRIIDMMTEFAKSVKLPELDIPLEVDGRVTDKPTTG